MANSSLGFILADAGYDVWIGNNRVNYWARKHYNLSADLEEFSGNSFHKMATHDLPAIINFILQKTGQEKLYYVGYSQGTILGTTFKTREFRYFDYGSEENEVKSNQTEAPLYRLEDMKVPTALWYGGEDWLEDLEDIKILLPQITNLQYEKYIPDWAHFDFIWGLDAPERVYSEIIDLMKKHP
ncbi:unnamed protein product [Natator depressus]